jgi:hypothetical protein
VYEKEGDVFHALAPLPSQFLNIMTCPSCRHPIHGLKRYGRIFNISNMQLSVKQMLIRRQLDFEALDQTISILVQKFNEQSIEFAKNVAIRKPSWYLDESCFPDLKKEIFTFSRIFVRDVLAQTTIIFKRIQLDPQRKLYESCVSHLKKCKIDINNLALSLPQTNYVLLHQCFERETEVKYLQLNLILVVADTKKGGGGVIPMLVQEFITKASLLIKGLNAYLKKHKDGVQTASQCSLRYLGFRIELAIVQRQSGSEKTDNLTDLKTRWLDFHENALPSWKIQRAAECDSFKKLLDADEDDFKMVFRVIQAEFMGTGHWYQCPNGHIYTIGECGQAMEVSRCAECGAVIGGTDHHLLSSNTRFGLT